MNPFLLGLLGLLGLTGASEFHKFENHAADEIKSKLSGDHRKVVVRAKLSGRLDNLFGDLTSVSITASRFSTPGLPLFTEPGRSHRGRIGTLRLDLRDFSLGKLHIDSLEASIPDCRFDLPLAMNQKQIRLSQSGVGSGSVQIDQADLEAFILRKFHEIKRVKVEIAEGRLKVQGFGEFLVVNTNFLVEGTLAIVEGTKLALADTRIEFDGKIADEAARTVLLNTLNPVVDLNRDLNLCDAITMNELRLENGKLHARGLTKIPELPREMMRSKP